MSEDRRRTHVGSHIVSGDADGIGYLRTLSNDTMRSLFMHASDGGEAHFSTGLHEYSLKRNPDYTFHVAPATSHHLSSLPG